MINIIIMIYFSTELIVICFENSNNDNNNIDNIFFLQFKVPRHLVTEEQRFSY